MPSAFKRSIQALSFSQFDVEASEPKIVSIDRVKVKSGLIIIDNPSGGEPGQKEYLVKSKRIWNKSKSQVAPRMLSHEHELRWWQPKASGERTVGGFLTSRDFANSKSMNAFVEDCKNGSFLIFSQFSNHCTMLLSCFLFTFSLQTSKVFGTSWTDHPKQPSQIFGLMKIFSKYLYFYNFHSLTGVIAA